MSKKGGSCIYTSVPVVTDTEQKSVAIAFVFSLKLACFGG